MSALPQDNHQPCSRSALGILPISLKKKNKNKKRERENCTLRLIFNKIKTSIASRTFLSEARKKLLNYKCMAMKNTMTTNSLVPLS